MQTATREQIERTVAGICLKGDELIAQRIYSGRLTTWEFRQFCRDVGVSDWFGAYIPGHPDPFPVEDPQACDACGAVYPASYVSDSQIQTIGAIRYMATGDCEPAEYEIECPDCGARDSFQRAVVCWECDEYPCCCDEANYET